MCFGGKNNQDADPATPAKPIIVQTPPPPEPTEKFPAPLAQLDSSVDNRNEGLMSPKALTQASLSPDRPWTPTHNKRSSRGTALIERNRLSDVDPHEIKRASYGDLGT